MKRLILIISSLSLLLPLKAQDDIRAILGDVERNNMTLKALRQSADAEKIGNRTGISLEDPEVEFNYLWAKPDDALDRKDISVRQTFDVATLSGLKSKIAEGENNKVEAQYKADRREVLLDAELCCLDLIYYNALLEALDVRRSQALSIAESQKKRLEAGDGNQLEYNDVRMDQAAAEGEIARITTERDAVISQLTALNGGVPVSFDKSSYDDISLPAFSTEWAESVFASTPEQDYLNQDIEVSKDRRSLSKTMSLPSLSAGYMGEFTETKYQGISLGVSIPLWSNRNKVRQAKAEVVAAEARMTDTKTKYLSSLEILYNRVSGLCDVADRYTQALSDANNSALLKKALDAGQISALDYTIRIGRYYEAVCQALDAQREYQKAYAEMMAYEL